MATVTGHLGAEPEKKRVRVYERWQGNETFFLWGHLVAGPNWRASLGTASLLLAPTGVFLAFVAPYLTRQLHVVIMVFSCILPVLSFVFLFMTACRDPGIIPRQEPDEEYLQGRKPRTKELTVNDHKVIIRYNDTCHFYQPPRAHHCSVNDNCIERFDHHCPWVGTTIGKRNYRTFLLFIYVTTVFCCYVCGCCVAHLFVRHNQLVEEDQAAGGTGDGLWGRTVRDVIPALVVLAYAFLFFWFVGGLSAFHCYLVATNQTTYENFRQEAAAVCHGGRHPRRYNNDDRPNPYSRGLWRNCADIWCTAVPPSKVRFRAYLDEVAAQPPVDSWEQEPCTPPQPLHPPQAIPDQASDQYQPAPYPPPYPPPYAPPYPPPYLPPDAGHKLPQQQAYGYEPFSGVGSAQQQQHHHHQGYGHLQAQVASPPQLPASRQTSSHNPSPTQVELQHRE
ncbi:hypothetical protein QJQ45_007078 [Haematococcus lacustris]|nr:hypothetical protein QJQ45_007078 [Haematococcus lacustris]